MSKKSSLVIPVPFHEVENGQRFYVTRDSGKSLLYKKISFIKAKRLFLKSPKGRTRFFWPYSRVLLCFGGGPLDVETGVLAKGSSETVRGVHSPHCDHAHDAKGPGACELSRVEQPHNDNGQSGPSC